MFRVGQKVARYRGEDFYSFPCPRIGEPLVITAVDTLDSGEQAILFSDYPCPPFKAWRSTYFRPFVERKTDIGIFMKMLKPKQRALVTD